MGCQEQKPITSNDHSDKYLVGNLGKNANSLEDDFSDLKEKVDESCDSEEEIEKKLVETKKAFKLQGKKDEDCQVQ